MFEIECRYELVESSTGSEGVSLPADWKEGSVRTWILECARDVVSQSHHDRHYEIDPQKDLFEQGYDRYDPHLYLSSDKS